MRQFLKRLLHTLSLRFRRSRQRPVNRSRATGQRPVDAVDLLRALGGDE